jgi:hypothetical protein
MKITELLTEDQIQEGPLLNKIGRGIGKAVGTAAKGVGAVAGGVAGLGRAVKKGFQAGKAVVGGGGDDKDIDPDNPDQDSAATTAPAASQPSRSQTAAPAPVAAKKPVAKTPKAAANTPAPTTNFGKLSAAAQGAPAVQPKQDTAYTQAQKAVQSLAPEQKKEIVTMLQADPKVKAAMTAKPAAAKKAAPAASSAPAATPTANSAPAATPTPSVATPAKTTPAPSASPEQSAATAKGKKKVVKKPAAPSQAEIDADRERIMGVTSDSVIRKQPALHESFSLFRKR